MKVQLENESSANKTGNPTLKPKIRKTEKGERERIVMDDLPLDRRVLRKKLIHDLRTQGFLAFGNQGDKV